MDDSNTFYLIFQDICSLLTDGGGLLIFILICVWLYYRYHLRKANKQAEIVLAVLEKGGDVDVDELFRKFDAPKLSLNEKLLRTLNCGMVVTALGLAILISTLVIDFREIMNPQGLSFFYLVSSCVLFSGIALIVAYAINKRVMSKEIDNENKKVR